MNLYFFRPVHWLLFAMLCIASTTKAQSPLDSLEQRLPKVQGKEKIALLSELAFQYCFSNTDKALHFGSLELQLASELGDSLAIANAWNDLAAAYISRGEFANSLALNKIALGVRARLGDSLLVASSLSKIGHAHLELGQLDLALPVFMRAATLYEQGGQSGAHCLVLNNIGVVYQRQGNAAMAISYFEKAIAFAESKQNLHGGIGPRSNLAQVYSERGENEKAKAILIYLVRVLREHGIRENYATITMNLGACYLELNQLDSARFYLTEAEPLIEERGDKKSLSMVKVDLGICYAKMRQFAQAEGFLALGKQYAEETNSNVQLKHVYQGMHDLELARGNHQLALEYFKKSLEYDELIRNEEINTKLADMEVRYNTEKKEKDLALREKQLASAELKGKNQQLTILLLAGGLLLVLGAVAFIIRRQKRRRERLEQNARLALQEERLRISRDLHDNIGAELTLITSSLEMMAYSLPDSEKPALENIGGYSRNAMAQLRETIWAIRSEAISVESLSLRLLDYAEKLCKPAGIQVRMDAQGDVSRTLSPTQTIHLYRLCQEAVHNAVKHAHCRNLEIHILSDRKQFSIQVKDDGKGFDLAELGNGYGIKNMRARAEEIGAECAVLSKPGAGTEVKLSLMA